MGDWQINQTQAPACIERPRRGHSSQTLNVSVYGKYNGLIRLLTLNLATLAVFSPHSRGFSKVSGKLNCAHLQQFASICKCLFILFLKVQRSSEGSGDREAKLICLAKNEKKELAVPHTFVYPTNHPTDPQLSTLKTSRDTVISRCPTRTTELQCWSLTGKLDGRSWGTPSSTLAFPEFPGAGPRAVYVSCWAS